MRCLACQRRSGAQGDWARWGARVLSWSWLCRHACVWRRCSSRSSGGGCACASRKAAGGSGDTGCPAQGRDNADAGSAAGVSVPDPSAGAKRVCGPAIRSTRCGRPPAVGIQVPQRPPRGPYGCTGTCPLWFGKYADGFF